MTQGMFAIDGLKFSFRKRAQPLPPEYRPFWKISVTLLSAHFCGRGPTKKSSINKIKILSWGMRDKETQEALLRFISGSSRPDDILLRHEPALVRTINICSGRGLMQRIGETIQITPAGAELISILEKDNDLLKAQKEFLAKIANNLSEALVDSIAGPHP